MDSTKVTLFNGNIIHLENLTNEEIIKLHFAEENQYAKAILMAPAFSKQREDLLNRGYSLIHDLVAYRCNRMGESFLLSNGEFGSKVVVKTLKYIKKRFPHENVVFFEAGFGPGVALNAAAKFVNVEIHGCDVDISNFKSENNNFKLYEGNVFSALEKIPDNFIDVFYWSDVLEHIPPDEIEGHIKLIYRKLKNKGYLITITPNWYLRPTDITRLLYPPGTESMGFHLKEYTYQQLSKLFVKLNFKTIFSPYFLVPKSREVIISFGIFSKLWHKIKFFFEPLAGMLPYPLKAYFIQFFGYHTIIARKLL